MKRKILALFMCAAMMLNYTTPALAGEGDAPAAVVQTVSTESVSVSDPGPAPVDPEPAPATPEPAPATPEPAPADPEPAPADPEPAPATPEPAPADPEPAPADPEPAPATPEPAPATPEPAPATPAPEATPTPAGEQDIPALLNEGADDPAPDATASPAPQESAAPESTPAPSASPAPEATASPAPESTAAPAARSMLRMNLLGDSGDSNGTSGTSAQTFLEKAEEYYGDGASYSVGNLHISWEDPSITTVKAGQVVNLKLEWKLSEAVTYPYTTQAEPLFDAYENTVITLNLPEGVKIVQGVESALASVKEVKQEGTKWTLVMDNESASVANAQGGTMTVPLDIGKNGQRPVGEILDFTLEEMKANLHTEFTIMDRTGDTDVPSGKSYIKDIEATGDLGTLTVTTDDVWGIEKKPGTATPNGDKTKVTVTYELTVGLLDANGQTIVTNVESYGRSGRVQFDTVTLKEALSVQDRQGGDIQPESITITPESFRGADISVNNNGTVDLPLATYELTTGVMVPYLSTYTVTAVYDYAKFIAQYYDTAQQQLEVNNTATLTYRLKGQTADTTKTATAKVLAGEVTQPAAINIRKYIMGDSSTRLYSAGNFPTGDPVTGPATFTITKGDGTGGDATIYLKQGNGTYMRYSGNTITIDPAGSGDGNSKSGEFTVYLDPGTYTVTESDSLPDNTVKVTGGANNADPKTLMVAAGEEKNADFYNKEVLGSITITKYGLSEGTESPLAGAEFALYQGNDTTGTPYRTGKSDGNGNITFSRLPYGKYTVKETKAPDGYIAETATEIFEINAGNTSADWKVTNWENQAYVVLTKYMLEEDEVDYVPVDSKYVAEFNNAFTLQKETSANNWETVENGDSLSLNADGTITRQLPVYDENGNSITYRFKETLPTGWHDPGNAAATEMYSDEFTLVNALGQGVGGAEKVKMENDRNGSITLTKEFKQSNGSGGFTTVTGQEATFTLYRSVDDGAAQQVGSSKTTVNGTLTFNDLERTDGSEAYQYYLVETPVAGYWADTEGTETITIEGGSQVTAWGPITFAKELNQAVTVKNYSQDLPVTVKKVDSVTNKFVSGAAFTVYAYDGNVPGNEVEASTAITSAGTTFYLEAGKKYIVVETTVPAGYKDVTDVDNRIIDLTGVTSADAIESYVTKIVTLKNRPDPQLLVNKTLQEDGKTTSLTGVTFQVYADNGGNPNTSSVVATVVSGTAKKLDAGTYWLKEVVPDGNPNGVLDPSKYPSLYTEQGKVVNGSFYFGPVELKEVTESTLATTSYAVLNYSQQGSVQVTKWARGTDRALTALQGAKLAIYKSTDTGYADPLAEATTNTSGQATFSGLNIYDEKGQEIEYIIKEVEAPEGYSLTDDTLTVTLEAGETVQAGGQGDSQKLIDLPLLSFQVTKVFYNIWEHTFVPREFLMAGAQIALYEKVGDEYQFRELATTDDMGVVTFKNLNQLSEYVAIEYDIPDEEAYKYLEPENGKDYLVTAEENGQPPATLTADQLKGYYYVTKAALEDLNNPVQMAAGTLTNVEHWTQLHIEKYVLEDSNQPNFPQGSSIQNGARREINNAEFDLYMQVLPEETNTAAQLQYSAEDAAKEQNGYTLVGSYSSGTLYDSTGVRQDGWFGTDILKSANNVVYWLVERTGGIGAQIDPEHQITLIRRQGTQYTNNSPSLEKPSTKSTQVFDYIDDTVTERSTQNIPLYGGGSAMFSTVRIAKWAGKLTEDGAQVPDNYTALGNATFEVWLAHENGTLVAKLDTITTGLDNDLSVGGSGDQSGPLTAWASSKAFSWTSITDKYASVNTAGVTHDVWWSDSEGNGYARVVLVESSAPSGYQAVNNLQLIMYFNSETSTTEVFNDVYYVKEEDTSEALSSTQTGWAFYPTEETSTLGTFTPITDASNPDGGTATQYRIVDWPVDNFAVTVNKYGYQVNERNLGLTNEQLSGYYSTHTGRVPLTVTMELQRWSSADNAWVEYAFPRYGDVATNGKFETENGTFSFPKGLTVGRYRLVEITDLTDYDNIYDEAALNDPNGYYTARAYYFQVTNENLTLDLYNPEKVDLTLEKTDADGTALSGAGFSLKRGNNTVNATTDDSGSATFTNLRSGVYILSETTAPANYSKAYLAKYLASAYSDGSYAHGSYALKNFTTSGIFLGYETELRNGEVIVTDQITLKDYGITDLTLDIRDPALCSLTIQKTDKDTGTALAGATFKLEYQSFASWSGDETVDTSGTWTPVSGTFTTKANGDGTINVTATGLQPGVYKVTETAAPSGYDLTAPAQYVVLTGGMDKTITLNGGTLSTAPLTFADAKKVNLTVTKVVNSGDLTVDGDHTFTFTLYAANKTTKVGTKTVTVTDGMADNAQVTATFTGLSQGATYYLKEEGDEYFALTSVTGATDPDSDGYYEFTVPSNGTNVSITAVNTYLMAKVQILKVDAANGNPLDGAGFEAYLQAADGNYYHNATGDWTDSSDTGNDTGEYTVLLPLRSVSGNTFKIQEMNAPAGYVNDHPYTEVTVTPGKVLKYGTYDPDTMRTGNRTNDDAAMLAERIFPNYQGSVIEITKYNNMKEGSNPQTMAAVLFNLYVSDGTGGWNLVTTQATSASGKASFTVTSGRVYAVAEEVPIGYAGLQGLYDGTTRTAMGTVQATIEGKTVTLYQINSGNQLAVSNTYTYNAYNIPKVDLEVRKQDAQNPNGDNQPTAVVNVYEVPSGTGTTLTQQQVTELMGSGTLVKENAAVSTFKADTNEKYNYVRLDDLLQPGKTYLVVETSSSMTQIRDNRQVVWYKVFTVAPGTTETQVVTLKNLTASVTQTLSKTTTTAQYESLLSQAAELQYTITPTVTNTYPLDSYVLKDDRLTAYNGTTALDFDTYLKDKYSITSVTVGQATHATGNYLADPTNQPIQATVTFYDFNDLAISNQTVDVSTSSQVVNLTGDVKAKWVEISYQCDSFKDVTGYALGQNFTPGAVTVKVKLDQQEGGAGIQPITKVTNAAETTVTWRPWDENGNQLGSQKDTKTAEVSNTFGEQKYAHVSVTKEADKGTVNLENDVITYTVTITNEKTGQAPFTRPFLVNLLPQGTVLAGDLKDAVELTDAPEGMVIENLRTESRNGETALFVFLSGNDEEAQSLKPGESAKVQIKVKTTASAALYGASIVNYVLLGSRLQGVESADNPLSTSWQTKDGKMPGGMKEALNTLVNNNIQRFNDLEAMVGEEFSKFGYISAAKSVNWSASSDASLVKQGKGDRTEDTVGFTSDRLSAVNNNGSMDYRLIFSNLSTNYNYTGVTLLDVLPYNGDKTSSGADRYSEWGLIFASLTKVEKVDDTGNATTVPDDGYKLLYYTTPINDSNVDAVYGQVKNLSYDNITSGWSETAPGNMAEVTAIALVFKQDVNVSLAPKESYQVEYRMNVGLLNEVQLAERSWHNTVNSFAAQYMRYTGTDAAGATPAMYSLGSNPVSATILPGQVQVAGHVWIDKNSDGVWDKSSESVSYLQNVAIVQQLLNNIEIRLSIFEGTSGSASATRSYAKASDPNWNTDAQFIFGRGAANTQYESTDPGLDPASPNGLIQDDGNELYDLGRGQQNQLLPSQLKGSAPKTYQLVATIPDTAGVLAEPTTLGKNSGRSRDPQNVPADEAADNNFQKAAGSTTSSASERFYLHATAADVYDNTKDIGLVLYRNVTVKKTAADNGEAVNGAKFAVYGPFNSLSEAQNADLSAMTPKTYETKANGEVSLGQLKWFQYYVIVETDPAPGYLLEDARATNTDGVLEKYTGTGTQNPAWVLKVPGDTVTNINQVISVTNVREVKVELKAQKTLAGQTLTAGQFAFQLLNSNSDEIQSKPNEADGTVTFNSITLRTPGEYTYYIREDVPADAAGGNRYQGLLYDETLYKAVVTVTLGTNALEAKVEYFEQNAAGEWVKATAAVFENDYTPAPAQYAPKVEKIIDTTGTPVNDDFTFTIERTDTGAADAVEMPADTTLTIKGAGEGNFGNIIFDRAGTYTFDIKEKDDSSLAALGYTLDTTVWTLTVEVEDTNGVLTVKSVKYVPAPAGQDSTVQATFTNSYTPKLTAYTPKVNKKLTGDSIPANSSFRFDLVLKSEPVTGAAILAADPGASITAAGSVDLPQITFRAAGTYTFAITERNGGVTGFTYDSTTWALTVKVEEDANGDLTVASAEYKKGIFSGSEEAASFTNDYKRKEKREDPPTNPPTTPTPPPTIRYYLPQTGDSSQLGLWAVTLAGAAGGLVWLRLRRRKGSRK